MANICRGLIFTGCRSSSICLQRCSTLAQVRSMPGGALHSSGKLSGDRRMLSGTSPSTGGKQSDELVTHTGQKFDEDDYRNSRFIGQQKLVNPRFAIDLIREDPVVICTKRVIASDSGGPLGHPKVYINLDVPGVHVCGYSGRKFVLKKYYNEKEMGPSISYKEYLRQIGQDDDDD